MARFIYKERKRKVKKIDLTNEYWLIGLGLFQFIGMDLWASKLGKILMIPVLLYARGSNNAIIYSCTKYLNCYEPEQNMLFNVEYPKGMIRPGKVTVYMNYAY